MISEEIILTPRFELTSFDESFSLETYSAWLADEEINRYLETRFQPTEVENLREFVQQIRESNHSYLFAVVSRETREHIGNIKLGPMNEAHLSASIGFFIGEKDWWGKGVAREIIVAITDWAFDDLNLEKLNAGSYASNVGSIKALESAGFTREGLQRGQVDSGFGYRDDVVLLGRLRERDSKD